MATQHGKQLSLCVGGSRQKKNKCTDHGESLSINEIL